MNFKKYAAPDAALFLILTRLQLWRTYGAKVMEKFFRIIEIALPLAILSICLFGYVLHYQSGIFREFQATLLSVEWMLLACIVVWCGSFIFLTFSRNDLPMIGLLLIAIVAFFTNYAASSRMTNAIILLSGVTLGRGARVLFSSSRCESTLTEKMGIDESGLTSAATFLIGLVILLAFSSWWHLGIFSSFYHGSRWMGLWDNPNIYGMLMGAGVVLACGLLAEGRARHSVRAVVEWLTKRRARSDAPYRKCWRSQTAVTIILFIATGMMAVGLFFSYSRGAWVGTAVGLLYLAKAHGKLKWRFVLPGIFVAAAVVFFFWHSTADTDAWYLKRLDLSRPSAQHRVSAWRGALQMMRDHPLGVGWNKAVGVYDKDYSPPEGGAAALTMNSYLMMGTELGLPGLVCFVAYVALCFKRKRPHLTLTLSPPAAGSGEGMVMSPATCHASLYAVCRAGAVVLLVAFWFDGGLFTLATASVFWILLELGSERAENWKSKTDMNLVSG